MARPHGYTGTRSVLFNYHERTTRGTSLWLRARSRVRWSSTSLYQSGGISRSTALSVGVQSHREFDPWPSLSLANSSESLGLNSVLDRRFLGDRVYRASIGVYRSLDLGPISAPGVTASAVKLNMRV